MAVLRRLINFNVINVLENANIVFENRERFQRNDPFELNNLEFMRLFRLSKDMVQRVIDIVEEYSDPISRRSALDAEQKVFTALRFYAVGSYQLGIGCNGYIGVSQSSVSRCIRDVNIVLNHPNVFNEWVYFPRNLEELTTIRNAFYTEYGFPGVVGCIDCTHVAIFPPSKNNEMYPEHVYVNRKGYHSINTQLICDSRMKILNVNARYPGSCHDSFIWNHCNVLPVMQTLHARGHDNFYLIGDSGYALRPWLLTPLNDVQPATPEERYNQCFKRTRSIIERCNGLLKMRFRCLLKHRVLHYTPNVASKIINSCVVLHNMCVENNLSLPDDDYDLHMDFGMLNERPMEVEAAVGRLNPDLTKARVMQRRIIRNFFLN
ncbi:putative nuclease HARBI1 [Solenopsis invicta]|uniref:putative nuclease HARBI1 n=1 Tax=Solenopsis invicta TaxID=13686 RepID=UPI00193DE1CF|nr:putative nuclease HARBI1 [Solenopsis invicta]